MILYLLFFVPSSVLCATPLVLKQKYYFRDSALYSTDFFDGIERFFVLEISRDLQLYKVKSSEIVRIFRDHGIAIEAKNSVVEFEKALESGELDELAQAVGEKFIKKHAGYQILIKDVKISPITSSVLSGLKLIDIDFDEKLLKRYHGTFNATFEDAKGEKRKLFFRYEVDATIEAIFTKSVLKSGDLLSYGEVEVRRIPFERVSSELMRKNQVGEVSVKSYTSANAILTQDKIIPKKVIRRGDVVRVIINEGGVNLEFSALAQQDGAVGEKIRVRNERNKKSYDVRVVDSLMVVID